MSRAAVVTPDHAGADVAPPPQPGEDWSESSHPPSPQSHNGGGTGSPSPSDDVPSPPRPPPPAPAHPPRASERKDPHDLRPNPKVLLAQAKRFATGVLEHYNKKKKIKFELLDAKPVISVPEPRCCYTHINFTARSSKKDSQEQLFFAETYYCGKRRAPSGFIVTCCEPLGPDSAAGQKFSEPDGTSMARKNADFRYCFACTEEMLHPRGENYVAGHCNIPHAYDHMLCCSRTKI
ncbi:unnamed protein product [Urochloa humidicola]